VENIWGLKLRDDKDELAFGKGGVGKPLGNYTPTGA
jgi:hypothetical protein